MAVKTDKEKKSASKLSGRAKEDKLSTKSAKKKSLDEEEDANASDGDDNLNDEEDDLEEMEDDWGKADEEDNWDPDFEEFDMPKSKSPKKAAKGKKGNAADEDDDLGLDLNLEDDDLFNDKDEFDEDDY